MLAIVHLYEDNAGGLFMHQEGSSQVHQAPPKGSTFADDAQDIDNGAKDWSQELIIPYKEIEASLNNMSLIASWVDGIITIHQRPGGAGQDFLAAFESREGYHEAFYPYTYRPNEVDDANENPRWESLR